MSKEKSEKTNNTEKGNRASFVLGVISVSAGWFLTWISVILSIIGLCLRKTEGKVARDITLNILGMIEGFLALCFWISF